MFPPVIQLNCVFEHRLKPVGIPSRFKRAAAVRGRRLAQGHLDGSFPRRKQLHLLTNHLKILPTSCQCNIGSLPREFPLNLTLPYMLYGAISSCEMEAESHIYIHTCTVRRPKPCLLSVRHWCSMCVQMDFLWIYWQRKLCVLCAWTHEDKAVVYL